MKIAIGHLKQIILEELGSYKRDEDEPEGSPKEDLGDDAYACEAEQTDIILGDLKKVLEKWEEGEYDSAEDRWQEYAKDVQGLVDQYEDEEAPEKHTEGDGRCEEVHSGQEHSAWEAEQEETGEEEKIPYFYKKGEKKKEHDKGFMPGHSHAKSIGSASKSKKSSAASFPYESKKLEQMVYQKLITALGGKE